jgi:spore coat protein U-like protein
MKYHTGSRLALRLASIVLASAPALASPPGTGTLTAQASVNTNCTITTTPVAFGAYDPIVANTTTPLDNGAGAISVACVKGSAPSIALDLGLHASGTTRRMQHATTPTEFLAYELYQPPNTSPGTACSFPGSTVWGSTGTSLFAPAAASTKAARTFQVCGTVAAGQNVEVGTFSDTVVATVTF